MPQFADYVEISVDALNKDPNAEFDESAFIEASRLVWCLYVFAEVIPILRNFVMDVATIHSSKWNLSSFYTNP